MSILFFVTAMILLSGVGISKGRADGNPLSLDISTATKGIAAVLVVLVHFNAQNGNRLSFLGIGYYCVGLFFFWSGYGMMFGNSATPPAYFGKKD